MHIKKLGTKAKQFLNIKRVFILSDPDRAPDILKIIGEISPKRNNIFAIYRTYGAPMPNLNRAQKKQILATISAKAANQMRLFGIHIPNSKLKYYKKSQAHGLFITASAHNMREIMRAKRLGIKNLIISPIFPSKSKSAKRIMGKIKLAILTQYFPREEFIALGGINSKTLKQLKNIHLSGIAGVSFN